LCATVNLSLRFVRGGGAGGTDYTTYEFVNHGPATCTLTGYPGVSITDAQGRIVQKPAVESPGANPDGPIPIRTVSLTRGGHATFPLNSTDTIPVPGCPGRLPGHDPTGLPAR
jgi:hypothetical protein